MTDTNPKITLSDVTWLTALARTLTRDGALADDLVQETWLVAKKSEPPTGITRPWLARVLRRLHLYSLRTEGRRTAREEAASSGEALTETSELVERAELQRTLADCLLGLEDPYRTTLMHVAFDERTPTEIAESESVSVASVRRRLRKARELFREKLEREYGREWKHWYAALLPYAEMPLPGELAATSAATSSGLSTIPLKVAGLIMSNSLLVSLTAVVGGGLVVSLTLFDRDGSDEEVGPFLSRGGSGGDTELVASATKEDTPASQRELAVTVPETTGTSTAPAATPSSHVLSGTLIMLDESDLEYDRANGEFALWTSTGTVQVPVVDGAWQLELALDQRINFNIMQESELVLDDRAGLLTGGTEGFEEERTLAQDTEFALVGRWLRPHRINVLDAETREHLSGLRIIERASFPIGGCFPHPGLIEEDDVVHEGLSSPIDIEPSSRYSSYFVGSEWHAWTEVEVDHVKGGEVEVRLMPAADLRVRFGGAHSGAVEFAIHIEGSTGCQIQRDVNTADELRFQGLPLGRYVLAARATMRAEEVRQEIEVQVGPNELVLDVPAYADERAPVAGTLLIDNDAEATVTELIFRQDVQWGLRPEDKGAQVVKRIPLSSMERVDGGFRFDAGELSLGTFEAFLEGAPWSTTFDLGPAGATDLRFDVDSQGEVFVRLINVTTSKVFGKTDNLWHDPQFELGREVDVSFVESKQAWRVRGPAGRLRGVVSFYYDYRGNDLDLDLLADPAEPVEIEIERYTTFSTELYDGDERVELSMPWIGEIEAAFANTGEPSGEGLRMLTRGWGISVKAPGVHVISFGELEGYEPIADMTVTLERGEHKLMRVELQKQ